MRVSWVLFFIPIFVLAGAASGRAQERQQEEPTALNDQIADEQPEQEPQSAQNAQAQEERPETEPVPEAEFVIGAGQPEAASGLHVPPPPAEVPTSALTTIDESEPNNLEPQIVPDNVNIRGRLDNAYDQDLFEFTTQGTTKVTITFRNMSPIAPTTDGLFPVGWRISLFGNLLTGASYDLEFGARLDRPFATRTVGLRGGTFLVRISPPFNLPILGFSKKPYTLEIRTEPLGDVRDVEPNDTSNQAVLIDIDGKPYAGWFQSVDDTDYYRIDVVNIGPDRYPIAGVSVPYYFHVSVPGEPRESVYLESIMSMQDCTIFASNDLTTPIGSFPLIRGRRNGKVFNLGTGTYFIRLRSKPYTSELLSYTLDVKPGQF